MKMMNRLATLPYFLTIILCIFLILPFGVYNIYTVYKSHSEMLTAMEKDFNAYLEWVLVKDRSSMAEFLTYRLNTVHRQIDRQLLTHLDIAKNFAETLYNDLPESKATEIFSKSNFSFPVYLLTRDRKFITGSKTLSDAHIRFLVKKDSLSGPDKNTGYLKQETFLNKPSYIVGTLLENIAITERYREDILSFSRHREDSGVFNFILEPGGRYVHNESRLFPGRRIAEKREQEKADAITDKFITSKSNNEEVVHYTWQIPGMITQPPQRKLAFARYEESLDWIIGVAIESREFEEYHTENQNHLKDKLYRELRNLMLPFSLLFAAMLLLGHLVTRKSLNGFNVFTDFFLKARKSNEKIDYASLSFEEFKELAVVVNKMVEDRKRQRNIILAYTKKLRFSNKKLRNMANKDGLTGVANRRYFNDAMEKSWQNELRYQKPIAIGMIDIDFFKQYNDIYGHQMGDKCLIRVAHCLKQTLKRPFDLVARYGGEEFVVLFPNTDIEGALEISFQFQREIEALKILHEGSPVSRIITCSIGLASIVPSKETSAKGLLEMADIALYNAKRHGRNRIVAHDEAMTMPGIP